MVDTGQALINAVQRIRAASVKFLLQQRECSTDEYSATCVSATGLIIHAALGTFRFSSSKVVRLLINAGADETSTAHVETSEGQVVVVAPLAFISRITPSLREKHQQGCATEEALHSLEATRRMLLRVDALRAVSWLWAHDVRPTIHAAANDASLSESILTPLTSMLPVLRRRAGRPRVLLSALSGRSLSRCVMRRLN